MADFAAVSQALADLQVAVSNLSRAIELKSAVDVELGMAQAQAASAAQAVTEADGIADRALEALVAALSAVGVGPAPSGPPIPD